MTVQRSFISVCIPMYNNANTIERCIRSVLQQRGEYEILIVDDGSSDNSVDIAAPMLRKTDRLVRNTTRLGLNRNHNKCLELAKGDLVQFVHGDDWLLPDALVNMSNCFKDPGVGFAFAPRQVVTDDVDWEKLCGTLHTHFRRLDRDNCGPSLVAQMTVRGMDRNWVGEPTCVMLDRNLVLSVGGFRDDIYQLVDLDLWLRLMLRTRVIFVPQEQSVRNHTGNTETVRIGRNQRDWLDRVRILTWLILDPATPRTTRMIASIWWLPRWLRAVRVAAASQDRRSRLKVALAIPLKEFSRTRRLRCQLLGPEVQPAHAKRSRGWG